MRTPFTIYRSSAGSGKTRTLAKAYLKLALQYQAQYFRHILAVTFTNKATQEMKDRILEYLDKFARDEPNDLGEELKKELGLDDATFRERSLDTQKAILHGYSQFSISTIDAFFQRVIRAFTRESGLVGDYRLEVEKDAVLQEVVDALIDELGENKELTDWVVEFARVNLENERAWDVRSSLVEFSKEIFSEEFKNIEDEVTDATREKGFFRDLLKELRSMKYTFVNFVRKKAEEALTIIHENGLSRGDFKYPYGGAYGFLEKLTRISSVWDFSDKQKGSMPENQYQDSANWPSKTTRHSALLRQLAQTKLIPILNEILEYRRKHYTAALSAEVVLANFYTFGLIADISRKLKEYKDENNMMLLDDAPKFLNRVMGETDTPFIYEKVGSFYRNYLIDEFQDTSGLQWKNFLPLVTNSISQGYDNLVVGDVKQAIYRWRGGDLTLLQQEVIKHIGEQWVTVRQLNSNYRSASNVVAFNNAFFKAASNIISLDTGQAVPLEVYGDVAQQVWRKEEGFVHVSFLSDEPAEETWKEKSLRLIPKHLEQLQDQGIALGDIAILVRKNEEGQEIVNELMRYSHSEEARPDCRYDVVSNESLRLDGASSVNLLVAAMRYLLNTQDAIARAQLAYEYSRVSGSTRVLTEVFGVSNQGFFEEGLPEAFARDKAGLKKLPLFELAETLIRIFGLGKDSGEIAYLQAFQDVVLEFSARERNDLGMFLEWWELNRHKKSVQISGGVDAVQILTIHKAKGLQFKVVLIPFCSWNLDHEGFLAPTLWVKTEHPPFNRAGYLPVKYSSNLKETYYSEAYQQERLRVYLDNLNLLYVALTRAEHGLIVVAPSPEVKEFKSVVARILHEGIVGGAGLEDGWDNVTQVWRKGSWHKPEGGAEESAIATATLREYQTYDWREKLVVKRSAKEFFSDGSDDFRTRINYGIHIHSVLSALKYASDVSDAMTRMVDEGLIASSERPVLQSLLDDLLRDPQIASWFSDAWDVRTEVPVLLPGGGESRMDRLLLKDKHAIVIDFKTGVPSSADQRQMQDYMMILTQMNFYPVEGYLLYIRTGEVVSVKTGKPRRVPKRPTGQLELEL
ncbi:MAG: UvrD-helicase domain-containing protein [Cyclobacteriaceae bacterium]|nr:UvrD-helicase domain-containing protein [Cyclobacteriaceae bacterium]